MVVTRKIMYYGSKLSENMTETQEGFLLCKNVPIGRTGVQEYLGQEIGLEYGKRYEVIREEDEVFSDVAMASFEGKPFTDEHPPVEVTPENVGRYLKGIVRDVRRGHGEQSDLLLADIVVYDRRVIDAIQTGKREVSCGYNCLYEPAGENQLKQTGIIGNHVALVQKGRAGSRVAIQDAISEKRREKQMGEKSKNFFLGRMFKAFAQDATPEEMEIALDEMKNSCGDEEPAPADPVTENVVQDEEESSMEMRLERLEAAVSKLVDALTPKEEPDALDQLETELNQEACQTGNTDEEAVTVEPETVNRTETAVTDHAALLQQIGALKPIVAQIKDPAERKKTADTLAAILRHGKTAAAPAGNDGYLELYQAGVKQAGKTVDSAQDERELGRNIAKKYNPHYKEEK